MAIRPIAYDPTGGITVSHDELGHGGAVAFADVRFGRAPDGSVDADNLTVPCPVCAGVSCHPIGGGAAPGPVQKLFLRTILRRAALLGLSGTFAGAKTRVRNRVALLEGLDRFRLAAMTGEDDPVDD